MLKSFKWLAPFAALLLLGCVSSDTTPHDLERAAQCASETLTAWPGVKHISTQFKNTKREPFAVVTYEFPRANSQRQRAELVVRRSTRTEQPFETHFDILDDRAGTYLRARDSASLKLVCHIAVMPTPDAGS